MDLELTDTQRMIQDAVRDFVEGERFVHHSAQWDAEARFPVEVWDRLAEAGWCGLTVPEQYGGSDAGALDLVLVAEELAKGDLSFATIYINTQYSGMNTVLNHGSEAQRAEYLPLIAEGKIRFSFGFTEPDGGTDILGNLRTRAVRDGGDFVINGSKIFTTGAQFSDYILLLAKTGEGGDRRGDGISLFIVPTDVEGLSIQDVPTMGLRATGTTQTYYDDVRVAESALVGEAGKGFYQLLGSLNLERILVAAMSVGAAERTLAAAVSVAGERRSFGKSVGGFQAIQHGLARCAMQIEAAKTLTRRAAVRHSKGLSTQVESAMCKVMASEAAWETALIGTRTMGGLGLTLGYPMQRYLRDAWPMMNGPVTTEQALNIIGESLGLERSY